ncbi:exodeoxyribonuclease-3 [Desulfosalsimonas propionicica]|uniref:Exodeoxyribonuclease-3 n=1 Tax=Desulfosalsimonas propionicica TaxID=332175 RepID=A0A7W0C7G4_9BACT|nr:exodeoxyribonuclease III [Desulfosalsimonas propionicica]MBA2880590.1 exodeoxyribonuclease-3 [Desulfosalsimonas propionicica]
MVQSPLKLISWNVNGLRAVMKKDFLKSIDKLDADIVALQETKIQQDQLTESMHRVRDYEAYFSHATVKKGYSGVATYTRITPEHVRYGIGEPRFDDEGRVIEMDLGDIVFFNVYFPNGQMSDERLQYKLDFYDAFFDHADDLRKQGKGVIVAGDFNTAHNEIDLKNPKSNANRSGFLRIERDWLDHIEQRGYVDTFRAFYPDTVKYSWWTYRFNARQNNAGWRIDCFFVTKDLFDSGRIADAFIDNDIYGSDHCPVGVVLNPS